MMQYYQVPPSPALEPYVQYFWVFSEPENDPVLKTYKVIADGEPGMVFQFNLAFYNTQQELLPHFFLYGQSTRNMYNYSRGSFMNIGVVLRPDAVRSIFGIDSCDLTNSTLDLSLLDGNAMPEQLINCNDVEEGIQLLSGYILRKAAQHRHKNNQLVAWASQKLLADPGVNSLKEVRQELNISERSLERLFKINIGMSPKLYARVCRFQASLNSLRNNGYEKLSDISYGNGYADQSHFIREFREFSGVTPNAWLRKAVEVVENYPEWKL